MKDNLIEKLANYEHERWSRWQKYVFGKCIPNEDGSLTIPKEYVDRWNKQINTNYFDLSNCEKESDMNEAIAILNIINKEDDFNE